MRQITLINNLIDQHKDYIRCKDKKCAICTEIKKISAPLNKDTSGKRIRQLLSKGKDITTNDVHFLIESGARKMDIRKALGMGAPQFVEFLDDIGLKGKREVDEEMKLSKVEYEDFKSKGKTDSEIAEEISVTGATIYNYKKKWYPDSVKTRSAKTKEYQETKKKVAAAVILDKNLEKALRLRITELEQQAKDFPEMVRQVEKLEEANIDLGNENSRLLLLVNKKSEEIKQLKDAATDLEEEIDDLKKEVQRFEDKSIGWIEQSQLYVRENVKITNEYKDLKNTLVTISRENKLTKALLKEVL
jgi:chromosome segregation ATPase